jgi:hypothetical protein
MSDYSTQIQINSIVFTGQARAWLHKHNLMPATWNLDQTEIERISTAGLALTIFNSPACTIPIGDVRQTVSHLTHIVVLDAKQIDRWITEFSITREETIATCLHEVGHVVNEQQYQFESEEFWADDYARHCGYESQLATALEKLTKLDPSYFDKDHTKERIKRIRDQCPVKLRWL